MKDMAFSEVASVAWDELSRLVFQADCALKHQPPVSHVKESLCGEG